MLLHKYLQFLNSGAIPGGASLGLLWALALSACGGTAETHHLDPVLVGIDADTPPLYEDGQMSLYEVRLEVPLPILAPDAATAANLEQTPSPPYAHAPWVTASQVRVQLSWTLANLDAAPHVVEVLVDPWNEFGRYFPGLSLVDAEEQEYLPNLSGIDQYFTLEGVGSGAASRRHGVFTYDDLEELAIDFSTVMNLVQNPPGAGGGADAALANFVNHAFAPQNRSHTDPLVARWKPPSIAGLVGLDIGLRTTEPANIVLEVAVEVVDTGEKRVQERNGKGTLLARPETVITIASPLPGSGAAPPHN